VLRYGNTRDLVLGLETVLPDGRVWSRLKALRKDNAGFDLKHLFIGSEGTLGIVTAATLRLFPRPRQSAVAIAAVPDAQAVLDLFVHVRNAFDADLTAFEFIDGEGMALACRHLGRAAPLGGTVAYAVLVELSSPRPGEGLVDALLACLEETSCSGVVLDAALASSQQQADFFWMLRESVPEAMLRAYPQYSAHDIAVPIARIPEFIHEAQALVARRFPELKTLLFGHVGDGNLHFNFVAPEPLAAARFDGLAEEAAGALYQLTEAFGGSISAEHGIGQHKRVALSRTAPAEHLDLMRTLKAALDRRGLMNPGKVFVPA
jgi:FAD/FMN-containing dehydrogenase